MQRPVAPTTPQFSKFRQNRKAFLGWQRFSAVRSGAKENAFGFVGGGPLIRPSATFSRVGEKGQDRVTSPGESGHVTSPENRVTSRGESGRHLSQRSVSPLPRPGEVGRGPLAGTGRVRAERLAGPAAPSSGLRPPSPALGRRDRIVSPLAEDRVTSPGGSCHLSRRIVSPLPRPGEVGRGPLAGTGRVRARPLERPRRGGKSRAIPSGHSFVPSADRHNNRS